MQDPYVGDIRDFAKYGLLRWLCRPEGPRLGVVWYRVRPEEAGEGGGNIDCYLWPRRAGCEDPAFCKELRTCDLELWHMLRRIRPKSERTVVDVDRARVLPFGTRHYPAFWTAGRREDLFGRALSEIRRKGIGLVFLDPDVGIAPDSVEDAQPENQLRHVLRREAVEFRENGKRSLVLVQFIYPGARSRRGVIGNRTENLCAALEGVDKQDFRTLIFCFRRCSGGANPNPRNGPPLVFFILPGSGHETWIDERLSKFAAHEHWGRFVSLGGGSKPKGVAPGLCRRCDACEA